MPGWVEGSDGAETGRIPERGEGVAVLFDTRDAELVPVEVAGRLAVSTNDFGVSDDAVVDTADAVELDMVALLLVAGSGQ
jgi:hypothetical protein